MAKITDFEGKVPKRIGNHVVYTLDGDLVVRANSGFTSKALQTDPKYALSRKNASEFGRVSSLCKGVRMALKDILPKKHNLAVVNSFTKIMREVMTYDVVATSGERHLTQALQHEAARGLLQGYNFNPNCSIDVPCSLEGNQLAVSTDPIVVPEGANCVGFRAVVLAFDFETGASQLGTGHWLLYGSTRLQDRIVLELPELVPQGGVVFRLLEVQFYVEEEGSYLPCADDRSKAVVIVSCI